jgi:hypothetical protein
MNETRLRKEYTKYVASFEKDWRRREPISYREFKIITEKLIEDENLSPVKKVFVWR